MTDRGANFNTAIDAKYLSIARRKRFKNQPRSIAAKFRITEF